MVSIFHASDLTPAGAHAFRHALRLAVGHGNQLTVMHIHGRGEAAKGWESYPRVRQTLEAWGLTSEHPTAGMQVRKIEGEGTSIAGALSRRIASHKTDLLVMASEGREGLAGFFKQSIALQVVRKTKVPALVLPNGVSGFVDADGSVNLDSVLVAVAHKPDPQLAVDAANWLIDRARAEPRRFVALHAGTRPVDVALPSFANASVEARAGDPLDVILGTADEYDAGLIVMTTEGRNSLSDSIAGTTTEQVCARARCPVMILPAPDYRNAPPI